MENNIENNVHNVINVEEVKHSSGRGFMPSTSERHHVAQSEKPNEVQIADSQKGSNSPSYPYNCRPTLMCIFYISFIVVQIILVSIIGTSFSLPSIITRHQENVEETAQKYLDEHFSFFNALQIVFILGLGMMHAYLKHYTWSAVGIQFFIAIFGIEIGLCSIAFWENAFEEYFIRRTLDFRMILKAEFNSFTTLISLSNLLGKLSLPQYFVLAIVESLISGFNYGFAVCYIDVVDDGGAMYVYCFGSIFGLFTCLILYCGKRSELQNQRKVHGGASQVSGFMALIGTCLVWIFMPAANVALTPLRNYKLLDSDAHSYSFAFRGIINSYFSLLGSVISGYMTSSIFSRGRFTLEHVLYSSICGGVAISGYCCINNYFIWSLIIGLCAGFVCSFFFSKIKPNIQFLKDYDSLGGIYVYGIPGFIGSLITCIYIGCIPLGYYGDFFGTYVILNSRTTRGQQAWAQFGALFITVGVAILGGIVTGLILKLIPLGSVNNFDSDSEVWNEESEPFAERINYIDVNGHGQLRSTYFNSDNELKKESS